MKPNLLILLSLAAISAHAADDISMDLSQRQFWHISRLIDTLATKGVIAKDIPAYAKQVRAEMQTETTARKKAYVAIGGGLREALFDPRQSMSDQEYRDQVRAHWLAVADFHHAGFMTQLKVYRRLPAKVKADIKAGKYDDLMPGKRVRKSKKRAHWMEDRIARDAQLTAAQTAAWKKVMNEHQATTDRFEKERYAPMKEKIERELIRALLNEDEKAALSARQMDVELQVELQSMKRHQFQNLYAILTPQQITAIEKSRAEAKAKAAKRKR